MLPFHRCSNESLTSNSALCNLTMMPPIALFRHDILSNIFDILLEEYITLPPSLPILNSHITLSGVCLMWRHMLLSAPARWDSFVFRSGAFAQATERMVVVHSLIGRSSSRPLSFRFEADLDSYISYGSPNVRVEDLLFGGGRIDVFKEIILFYADRLISLECLLHRSDGLQFLFNAHHGAFKSLEFLDITFLNTPPDGDKNLATPYCHGWRDSESLPRLKQACYRMKNSVLIHPYNLKLPLPQLTKLHIETTILSRDLFLRITQACRYSLIDGYFCVQIDFRSAILPLQCRAPIEMASLKKLRLRLIDLSFHRNWMLMFSFPILKDVWIEEGDRNSPFRWDVPFYRALLLPSRKTLEKLQLVDIRVDAKLGTFLHRTFPPRQTSHYELEKLLKTLCRIKELCLPLSIYVHHTTLSKIAGGSLLRRLETLELGTADPSIVFGMVRRRNVLDSSSNSSLPSPITSLALNLPSGTSDRTNEIDAAAQSLPLACECDLGFVPRCSICARHCCFSS